MNCPVCASNHLTSDRIYNGYQLERCAKCSLVFTEQRTFSKDQYDAVYSDQYSYRAKLEDAKLTHAGKKGPGDLTWVKRKALGWLEKHTPKGGRLLDLGSGPGTFLMVAQRSFGFRVEGLEVAQGPAALANELGIKTFCGPIEQFGCQTRFDAITSFEVLEHVTDPISFLKSARQMLTPDGVLIMSVPNLDDPYCLEQQIASAMPPLHINFFSRRSLGLALERAGFAVDRFHTLPIPSSSVRNIHGKKGWLLRLPYLGLARLAGKADGTTLMVMARPS